MSLSWPRENGAADNPCRVRFRQVGMPGWREAQALWWDRNHGMYAGSVVGLESGTAYEFKLDLAQGGTAVVHAHTWPEEPPVARIIGLPAGTLTEPLHITQGGTASGMVVYQGHAEGTTIDADPEGGDEAGARDHCLVVDADYVVVRGLRLVNAARHALLIRNRHDVVIEGCEITNWGRRDPRAGQHGIVQRYGGAGRVEVTFASNLAHQMDSAIKGEGGTSLEIERVVVQGNRIHHPRYGANSWSEPSAYFNSFHPQGAKAVCLFRPGEEVPTLGNHVIRFNDFFSDRDRMFYDILFDSQGSGSKQGTDAQRDIDVYGNSFRDCWDDCMELERGFGNVRVFGNYFDRIFKASTAFATQSGPIYMFRNVFDRVLQPSRDFAPDSRAWTGCAFQSGDHRFYFYHNTLICPGGDEGEGFCWAYGNDFKSINVGRGVVDDGTFTISRNNIYQTIRWPDEVNHVTRRIHGGFDFDYDLYDGVIDADPPEAAMMWGRHAVRGVARFRRGHGAGQPGRAQLDEASAGRDSGCRLPNFNDDHEGGAPDMGAHEYGSPDMPLGAEAHEAMVRGRASRFTWDEGDGTLRFRLGENGVADYCYRDRVILRPFFSALQAPDGTALTRTHPPVPGIDADDHASMHPGAWLAFGSLNGVDFWRNQGRIDHVRFLRHPSHEAGRMSFGVEEAYRAIGGEVVCRGVSEYVFVAGESLVPPLPGTLLLWTSALQRDEGPLVFGPQHEMGLGIRVATPLTVAGGRGRLVGSHGGLDENGNWGKGGDWWDYSGAINGRRAGIVVVPAPGSPHAVWAHARDYGFLALNPTGPPADARDVPSKPFTVAAGQTMRFTFGLLLHASPEADRLDPGTAAAAVAAVLQEWRPVLTPVRSE